MLSKTQQITLSLSALSVELYLRHTINRSAINDLSNGGGERDRTDDILLAKQALSQLSYTPISQHTAREHARAHTPHIVKPGGSGWIRTNDPRLIKTVL